jgi:hypothetical protein
MRLPSDTDHDGFRGFVCAGTLAPFQGQSDLPCVCEARHRLPLWHSFELMTHLLRTFVHEEIGLRGFTEDGRHELVPGATSITLGRSVECQMVVSCGLSGIGLIGGRRSFTFRHDGEGWRLYHGGHNTAVLVNGVRFADGAHRLVDGDELSFLTVSETVAFTLRFVADRPAGTE